MNTDQITEKRAIEKRMDAFVSCNKDKGTLEEQAQFLKDYAIETGDDLYNALYEWGKAEVRVAKARGEMDEDEDVYAMDDEKSALLSLVRGVLSILHGEDPRDIRYVLELATEVFNRTPVKIDADDETWLEDHGMNI